MTGALDTWWLMQLADDIYWWTDQFIVNMLADLPPQNLQDLPLLSPPDCLTLPAAQICPPGAHPDSRPDQWSYLCFM